MNFKNIIHYKVIPSTQKEAWNLYAKTKEKEALIIADTQSSGIGTHGRVWLTGEGNIAFSILFRLNDDVKILNDLSYKVAQIILNIFKEDYDIKIDIKKPNDLMINGHKTGGILVESKIQKNKVKALVIGIGINISSSPKDCEIKAISINEVYDKKIDKEKLIYQISEKIKKEILERISKI